MHILTHRKFLPSVRALRGGIYNKTGKYLYIRTTPHPTKWPLIRWGNSSGEYWIKTVQNSQEVINTMGDKVKFSKVCSDAGIPHLELKNSVPTEFPIVVRTLTNSFGGRGIIICRDQIEYGENNLFGKYWSKWRNFKSELGVHLINNRIVRVFKKVKDGGDEVQDDEFPIRNSSRGYKFSLRDGWREYYPHLEDFIADFIHKFPYYIGFCRLDIGITRGNDYVVIEGNSAPGISENPNTLEIYVNELIKELGGYLS